MDSYDRKYNAFQIPGQPQDPRDAAPSGRQEPLSESFYEIEYDSCPIPGVGKFVLKSRKIETPKKDEIRERFQQMRNIAREDRYLTYNSSRFYDKRVQQENARIFYRQGMFMKDFEDDYVQSVPFSSYFPDYQMMGYEQLRTYFTWRTQVRRGNVADTSLSYFFLYCYELLNNIGVEDPAQGLEQLLSFWNAFRMFHPEVDKYVLKWLKDYHIYYELPWSFKEFLAENGLTAHYPRLSAPGNRFDLLCSISKYDIRKSGFYNDDTVGLIRDCFDYLLCRLEEVFEENQIILDNLLFQPNRNMTPWTPFADALFCPGSGLPDRQVVLSEKEIYACRQGRWTFQTTITTESGKRLTGYIFKQMESVLRKASGYKYKLSANINTLNSPLIEDILHQTGMDLEKLVTDITLEFYREATKTVVSVNPEALEKIRQEALITQERLIVPDEDITPFAAGQELRPKDPAAQEPPGFLPDVLPGRKPDESLPATALQTAHPLSEETAEASLAGTAAPLSQTPFGTAAAPSPAPSGTAKALSPAPSGTAKAPSPAPSGTEAVPLPAPSGTAAAPSPAPSGTAKAPFPAPSGTGRTDTPATPWQALWNALTPTERQAVFLLWQTQSGEPLPSADAELSGQDIRQFADAHNVMLEVLMDGINEKSMDFVGDSLLDGEFMIYEDYTEQVKEMVNGLWQDKYPLE